MLELYGDLMNSPEVDMEYPASELSGGGDALDMYHFRISSSNNAATRGDLIGHELGHLLRWQLMGTTNSFTYLGGGWDLYESNNEGAATFEAWASYVGARSWYKPWSATNPLYHDDPIVNADTAKYHNCLQSQVN